MKKKHLLLSAMVAVGLQFTQAQEMPSDSRMQEIQAKVLSHKDSPTSLKMVLSEDEYKDWVTYYQFDTNMSNSMRGQGETIWSITDLVGGGAQLYTMPKAGPYELNEEGSVYRDLYADDVNGEGVLYAIDWNTLELVTVANNAATEVVTTLQLPASYPTGLSWNSQDDTFYSTVSDGTDTYIVSIDMESGESTTVASMPGVVGIWLEIDDNNMAYVADIQSDILLSYNMASDEVMTVGNIGYDIIYAQEADFDSETGTLYAGMYFADMNGDTTGAMATVDTETGLFTMISDPTLPELTTLSIVDELPDGPEPVETGVECGQIFADSGGVEGNYQSNEFETYVIDPETDGEYATITFTQVDIEVSSYGEGSQAGCWDYLSIYNGPSTNSEVIAQTLCGEDGESPYIPESELLVGDSFTSTDESGALTVTFTSDSSVTEGGWQADITCSTMAVDEVQLSQFNYYPNPTTGSLQVAAKSDIERLELFNVLGQKVYEAKPGTQTSSINMSSLKPGTYILRATVDGKVVTNKVMKK